MALGKVGSALSKFSRVSRASLRKAARARDRMEREFDRVFGKDALRGSPVSTDRVRKRVGNFNGSSKSDYFNDLSGDKINIWNSKKNQVKEKKFF
ncbi:MAG: hypothetical protein ABEK36_01215 [Candidatus Aenigmatarchaeota archaeon]